MHIFQRPWLRRLASEKGQDAAEYALLIGLIALVIVVAITALGLNLAAVFDAIAAGLAGPF